MQPCRRSIMCGITAFEQRQTPLRSMSIISSHSCSVSSQVLPAGLPTPALLIRTSICPSSAMPSATTASISLLPPYVHSRRDDARAERAAATGGLLEVRLAPHRVANAFDVRADVGEEQVGPLLGEAHRVRAALPARALR